MLASLLEPSREEVVLDVMLDAREQDAHQTCLIFCELACLDVEGLRLWSWSSPEHLKAGTSNRENIG